MPEEPIMARDYEPTLDDEREVELDDDPGAPIAPPTLDPEERFEAHPENLVPYDDDREEPVW
ncbi:MAG: hypothetical protein JWQ43_2162 [Glaciihabitans sp.]|nr:hypothetical protein [Glaciihabitans sp.]